MGITCVSSAVDGIDVISCPLSGPQHEHPHFLFLAGSEQKRSSCMSFVVLVEETSTPILCQLSHSVSHSVGNAFLQWSTTIERSN